MVQLVKNMNNFLSKVTSWIKNNKLSAVLIIVLAYLLFQNSNGITPLKSQMVYEDSMMEYGGIVSSAPSRALSSMPIYNDAAPTPEIENRKVVTDASISLQVKNVSDTIEDIKSYARQNKGYMVNTSVTTQEYGERGSIDIRVPSELLDQTLAYLRGLSIKVVNENVSGSDITDSYVNIEERLSKLRQNKERFETFMAQAENVEEILKLQREIMNLQNQIDSYEGQLKYMDGTSSTTLIRIDLATDELGLPYAPVNKWRPDAVAKEAVRSMLNTSISIVYFVIRVVVYLPLILLALALFFLIKKVVYNKPNRKL